MTHKHKDDQQLEWPWRPRKFGWPVHAGIVALGLASAVTEIYLPGWGIAGGIWCCVVGGIVLLQKRYWHQWIFWGVLGLLALLQIPLLIWVRPFIAQLSPRSRFSFMLVFAMVDFTFMASILTLICVDPDNRDAL